jgi:hypothetical protein
LKNKAHNLSNDETLPIINKSKHPKKGEYKEKQRKGPTSKKTKEPPKEGKPPRNIKFPNTLLSRKAYQIIKGRTS